METAGTAALGAALATSTLHLLRYSVPVAALRASYLVDCSALGGNTAEDGGKGAEGEETGSEGERERERENVSEHGDADAEEGEKDGRGPRAPVADAQTRRRRRDEEDEYDYKDPFIDDGELPVGVSLYDLLSGSFAPAPDGQQEPAGGAADQGAQHDFYVWQGKLPEREVAEPLADERKTASGRAKRKLAGDAKRTKKRTSSSAEAGGGKRQKGVWGEKGQRAREDKAPRGKKTKPDDKDKKRGSVLNRILAINGDESEDSQSAICVVGSDAKAAVGEESRPVQDSPHASQGQDQAGKAGGEERVRKKFDVNTPFLELEYRLAMGAFEGEARRTAFSDPKRFPSNLRPFCSQAVSACLREGGERERRGELSPRFFAALADFLPFSQKALEKMIASKLAPLYREELWEKTIPELMAALSDEVRSLQAAGQPEGADGKRRTTRVSERARELIYELIKSELDAHALDRLHKTHEGQRVEASSDMAIRKAVYQKIAALWVGGEMTTAELGKEYSIYRRRIELKKLKDHGIEVTPILVPVAAGKSAAAHANDPPSAASTGSRDEHQPEPPEQQADGEANKDGKL